MDVKLKSGRIALVPALIFAVLFAAISAAGYLDYRHHEQLFKSQIKEELSYVADLKVRQIAAWLREREADATLISASPVLAAQAAAWMNNPSDQRVKEDILRWMRALKEGSDYEAVLLLDAKAQVRLSVPPEVTPVSPGTMSHVNKTFETGRPLFTDLHLGGDGKIHLSLFAPLTYRSGGKDVRAGTLIAGIDPGRFLYSLVQTWPRPSRTAETLLVRREGNDVVFLNELRHRPGTALSLRLPITTPGLPAAMAATGWEGLVEGRDYRGVPVVGAIRSVPGSTWSLVAKMDTEEIYAPLRQRARDTGALVGFLILAAGVSILFYAWKQRVQFQLKVVEAALERRLLNLHYEEMAKNANDIMLLADSETRILAANDRALAAYGYTQEEMLRLRLPDLRAPATVADFDVRVKEVEESGGRVFETVNRRKNGETFQVEVSARTMEIEGRKYYQSIIRDITERKRAEEQVAGSERKFRSVFEQSNDGIFLLDGPEVVDCNPMAEKMFGMSRGELVGTKPWDLSPQTQPDGRSSHEAALESIRAAVSGEMPFLEWRCKRAGGEYFDIEIVLSLVEIDRRKLVMAIFRDVTERLRDRQALRLSEAKYRSLVERMPAITYMLTPDDTVTPLYVSPQVEEILGFRPEEIVGHPGVIRDRIHPDDLEQAGREFVRVLRTGGPVELEYRIFHRDGSLRWLQDRSTLVRDNSGQPLFVQGVAMDVSGAKLAQEELRKLSGAIEHSPASVMITDAGENIEYVNPRFTEITGYSRDEVIGRTPRLLQSGRTQPEEFERLHRSIHAGLVWHGEYQNRRKNGEIYWERASVSPIRDEQGKVTHFVQVSEDVTHEKTLERQIHLTQKMEAIGRLAGGIAHDFNNILTVISGYADMALSQLGDEHVSRGSLEEIVAAADRGSALTRQLLVLGRDTARESRTLDLNALIEGTQKMLRHLTGEKTELVLALHAKPGRIKADPAQIVQVLMNLVANASDAMPSGGIVKIETSSVSVRGGDTEETARWKPGEYVRLAIRDTGAGMDEETQAHIFEPFFTTKERGTGLGLSSVYGIVQRSGGQIAVASQPGLGTTFALWLPEAADGPGQEEAQPVVRSVAGSETILLVEDEEEVRKLVREVLHMRGYEVLEARSSEDALSLFASYPGTIDLLLTDVVMPGMLGHELAARLTGLRPGLKVLYMSGDSKETLVRRGFAQTAADFLGKPFAPDALAARVREVLDLRVGS